jgi:hypothetical protein
VPACRLFLVAAAAVIAAVALAAATRAAPTKMTRSACSSGFVSALVGGEPKCLHAGEFCSPAHATDYARYGFACLAGRLEQASTAAAPSTTHTAPPAAATSPPGLTVAISPRRRASGCRRGPLPDRRCSPGAYYSRLTRTVICSPSFRTSTIRDVPQSEKFQVESEYGIATSYYGRSIEIDHIIPLELGGSNQIANLFPEPGSGPANYHQKDRLENQLHDLVCAGQLTLTAARRQIATNWETLYRKVFAAAP